MFKRVIWWAVGATMGSVGSHWAQRKVKRKLAATVSRYTPPAVAGRLKDSAVERTYAVVDGVRTAVETGKEAAGQRDTELRSKYGIDRQVPNETSEIPPHRKLELPR